MISINTKAKIFAYSIYQKSVNYNGYSLKLNILSIVTWVLIKCVLKLLLYLRSWYFYCICIPTVLSLNLVLPGSVCFSIYSVLACSHILLYQLNDEEVLMRKYLNEGSIPGIIYIANIANSTGNSAERTSCKLYHTSHS